MRDRQMSQKDNLLNADAVMVCCGEERAEPIEEALDSFSQSTFLS